MQPTYLPWIGYFDLIDQSDVFVFLDTVAFSRQSWQQRNRVLTAQGVRWLTVPVHHTAGAPIREIAIDNTKPWRRKHWATLEASYLRAPHWAEGSEPLARDYSREWNSLAELNIRLIREIASALGVEARFERSSELPLSTRRKEGALIDLCEALGATTYLSPPGSFGYLGSDMGFASSGIELRFQRFEHPAYEQGRGEFVPYLSAVDLLFNAGPAAAAAIRKGRRPMETVEQMQDRTSGGDEGISSAAAGDPRLEGQ